MKRKAIITIVTEGPDDALDVVDVAVQCDFDPPVDAADVPMVANIVAVAVAAIESYIGSAKSRVVVNPEESI